MSRRIATLIAAALAALALAAPAQALGAAQLEVSSSHILSTLPAGGYAAYTLTVSNAGDEPTSGEVTVDFGVPADLEVVAVDDELNQAFSVPAWSCAIAGDSRSVSCEGTESTAGIPIEPGGEEACSDFGVTCRLLVTVKADPGAAPGTAHPTIEASGGNASAGSASDPIEVTAPASFETTSFDGKVLEESGAVATQAGSHPFSASTEFSLRRVLVPGIESGGNGDPRGEELTVEDLKDAVVKLPPGVLGNPQASAPCTQAQLAENGNAPLCPPESQVGTVTITTAGITRPAGDPFPVTTGLYNMEAAAGTPAILAFNYAGNVTEIYAKVRSGADYGVDVAARNAPQSLVITDVEVKVWGVPADPAHDPERHCAGASYEDSAGCLSSDSANPKPFFTLPTSCVGPVQTDLTITSWEGGEASSSFLSHDNGEPPTPIGVTGCNAVDFSPTLEARPTTNLADSPSGLDVDLHVPRTKHVTQARRSLAKGPRPTSKTPRSPCPRAWSLIPREQTASAPAPRPSSASPQRKAM